MSDDELIPEAEDRPKKRWRWAKRVCGALIAFVVISLIARIWWGLHAEGKLQEVLDRIAARGEPIRWADLAPPPVPDERNAALLYKQAAATPLVQVALSPRRQEPLTPREDSRKTPECRRLDRLGSMIPHLMRYPEFRRKHPKELAEVLRLSKTTLALCRKARGLDGCNWGIDFDKPRPMTDIAPLRPYRILARLLCLAAVAAHEAGSDAEAHEYIHDALALSDAVDVTPTLISHLVAVAIDAIAADTTERIAPGLGAAGAAGMADRKAIRRLAEAFLDTTERRKGVVRAYSGERTLMYEICERLRRGDWDAAMGVEPPPVPLGPFMPLIGPMLALDEARMLRRHDARTVAAKEAKTFPEACRRYRDALSADDDAVLESDAGGLRGVARALSSPSEPTLERFSNLHFRVLACRTAVAISLAVQVYQAEHGRRPATLQDLVPDYLSTVPVDPFDSGGRTMRYQPDLKPPLLYSVGDNSTDDGGSFLLDEEDGTVDWHGPDMPFFLNGDRPLGTSDWEDPRAAKTKLPDGRGRGGRSTEEKPASAPTSGQTREPTQSAPRGRPTPQAGPGRP